MAMGWAFGLFMAGMETSVPQVPEKGKTGKIFSSNQIQVQTFREVMRTTGARMWSQGLWGARHARARAKKGDHAV